MAKGQGYVIACGADIVIACRFHIQLPTIFDKEALNSHCHISFINKGLEVLVYGTKHPKLKENTKLRY
uniref:Uncharacterized protein n=1 Tax=Medicago truncatula TaxID=3880 RepID=Q2HUR6_MEDTR|nr:hypothetical protein MtrDRAFT_AC149128g18v2 [Medicago truncatula]